MSKKIVSVQDISCYGQCSLTVALPVLSAYGIETAILPSAILSTHTGGFTDFSVLDLTEEMPKIVRHWEKEGLLFDAIYTGYIGDARQFDIIRGMRSLMKADGKLIVDPAMADHGKLYKALNEDIVDGMRNLVREADFILPNLTEAAFLLKKEFNPNPDFEEVKQLCRELSELGPSTVVITGVAADDGKYGAVAYQKETDTYVSAFAERMPRNYHGTGDLFSSVVIAGYLNGKDLRSALLEGCDFVVEAIRETIPDETHGYGVKFEQVLMKQRN